MGVKNLWDILESCKQTLPLHHLQNKRLCVDLSCWLIQLQNANKSPHCIKDKLYLKGLFHRVRALIALNCSLVFVTDGSIPSIKLAAYRRRLGVVLEDIQETTSQTVQSLRRNMGSEFSCMIKEAKALGLALGIPYLDGIEEAEAQCASLNSASLCDGCFTLDSDIFLFGARTVYKDIVIGEGGYVTCYEMGDIERKLGYGRKSLISLALLLGSDYSQGVRGLGREAACQIVKSIGEDNVLRYVVSEELTFARKSKGTKKPSKALNNVVNKENAPQNKQCIKASDENSGSKDQFVQVISAYMSPKCHCPDSAVVQRVCVHLPFLRTQFQRICAHSFGWTPEQTDQYILPKIAERDLRRFANLRAKSSELGAKIPLEKMPIPCPIAAIVKPRRVQKIDCYEVSWNGVEGLQTSIVPSDLVESACPEKIAEFMEKKVEEKKQSRRPRPRKSTKAADVSEVDLHLQDLHLNNEPESNASLNTIDYRHSASLNTESSSNFIDTASSHHPMTALGNVDQEIIDLSTASLNTESSSNFIDTESSHHPMTALGNVDHEIIDLSTPSSCASKVANLRKDVSLPVDVIDLSESETDTTPDLSESETDTTPEHEKKARELRLFIESIKGDLY